MNDFINEKDGLQLKWEDKNIFKKYMRAEDNPTNPAFKSAFILD